MRSLALLQSSCNASNGVSSRQKCPVASGHCCCRHYNASCKFDMCVCASQHSLLPLLRLQTYAGPFSLCSNTSPYLLQQQCHLLLLCLVACAVSESVPAITRYEPITIGFPLPLTESSCRPSTPFLEVVAKTAILCCSALTAAIERLHNVS